MAATAASSITTTTAAPALPVHLVFDAPLFVNQVDALVPSSNQRSSNNDRQLLAPFTITLEQMLTSPVSCFNNNNSGDLKKAAQPFDLIVFSNYRCDMSFMFRTVPMSFWLAPNRRFLFLLGEADSVMTFNLVALTQIIPEANHKNFVVYRPVLPISYGTHHTKAIFCFSQTHMRCCIGTANFWCDDLTRKSEMWFVRDYPRYQHDSNRNSNKPDSAPLSEKDPAHLFFGLDLQRYLTAAITGWQMPAALSVLHADLLRFPTRIELYDFSGSQRGSNNSGSGGSSSSVLPFLIGSVPGTHRDAAKHHFGIGALSRHCARNAVHLLSRHKIDVTAAALPYAPSVKRRWLTFQFSSLGTMNDSSLNEFSKRMAMPHDLAAPFEKMEERLNAKKQETTAATTARAGSRRTRTADNRDDDDNEGDATFGEVAAAAAAAAPIKSAKVERVVCILPTMEEVRTSIEGWRGGYCLPITGKCMKAGSLSSILYRYTPANHRIGEGCGFHRAMPHIKSYTRMIEYDSDDSRNNHNNPCIVTQTRAACELQIITSANLSNAAWGASQVDGNQIFIRSYELGVAFDSSVLPPICADAVAVAAVSEATAASGSVGSTPTCEIPFSLDTSKRVLSLAAGQRLRQRFGLHFFPLAASHHGTNSKIVDGLHLVRCSFLPYDAVSPQRYGADDLFYDTETKPQNVPDVHGQDAKSLHEVYTHYGDTSLMAPVLKFD